MSGEKNWEFDEKKHTGTDYNNAEKVQDYDEKISLQRDIPAEISEIVQALNISGSDKVLEIGSGTGTFALELAKHCTKVFAAEASEIMLSVAEEKAEKREIKNIEFISKGFLHIEDAAEPVDHIITQFAMHYLPDFWKMIALKKMNDTLKPGGKLFLKDIVFSLNIEKYEKTIDYTVKHKEEIAGEQSAREFESHISSGFSTFDWIMEEMLYRAGFDIIDADYGEDFVTTYVCIKSNEKRR